LRVRRVDSRSSHSVHCGLRVHLRVQQLESHISTLALTGGVRWSILSCEDVTAGAAATPLLDLGVILRARRKSDAKGDSTVKLRPCRWSQLDGQYFVNADDGVTELKVEPDWAGSGRQLAASMTAKWSDGRMSKVQTGDEPPAYLFTDRGNGSSSPCAAAAGSASRFDVPLFGEHDDQAVLADRPVQVLPPAGDLDGHCCNERRPAILTARSPASWRPRLPRAPGARSTFSGAQKRTGRRGSREDLSSRS
jgi:hypothetical protein